MISNKLRKATMFLCTILVASSLAMASAPVASAQQSTYTLNELRELVSQLLARLNELDRSITPGVCPYTWTRSLGQGSTGPDVLTLQRYLNQSSDTRLAVSGPGSPGNETQYYGPITANAVSRFQSKYSAEILLPLGLVSPTGYFGPSSMAKANSLCVSIILPPSDDNGLQGGAGTIDQADFVSSLNNEEVGEGQEDVEVLGLELEPSGSDVEILAVTVDFDQNTANNRLTRYAEEVSVWFDGEEVARMDASDFARDDYRLTITLDDTVVIREGNIGELVIAVSGANNIDSNDIGESWDVSIDSVRYRDAQNAILTESSAGDIGSDRTFTFEDFATAADLSVRLRSGDSDINTARTIEVSSDSRTDNEAVLSFEIEVEGDSDILLDDLVVSATTTGGSLSDVVSLASLYMNGDRVGSENISASMSSNSQITFDDLDLELDAGSNNDFEVRVDLNRADGSNYSSGATIDLDITGSNRDAWDIEDEEGDDVSANDRRGTASSDAHTLRTEGLSLQMVDSSGRAVAVSGGDSYGEFKMEFELTAIGDDIYVPETVVKSATASTTVGATFYFTDSSGSEYSGGSTSMVFFHSSGGESEGGRIRIEEGETARFMLTTTLDPAVAGQYRGQLVSIGFNDTNATPDVTVLAVPMNSFRTDFQFINN